jgi:hypothetical protein
MLRLTFWQRQRGIRRLLLGIGCFPSYEDCCVLCVFVAEQALDVEHVVGFVVFCCCFPMSKGVEGDVCQPEVLEFKRCFLSLVPEGCFEGSEASSEDSSINHKKLDEKK